MYGGRTRAYACHHAHREFIDKLGVKADAPPPTRAGEMALVTSMIGRVVPGCTPRAFVRRC
jgi:hypothetical protein